MKKIILLFGIVLCGCGACSENKNNNKPTFNPTTQETVVTNKISNISKTVSPINGNIALSVIVQNNLPSESAELLKSKIINIITHNGIASQGVNPQIIVAPTLTEINYDITSTLPQKHKINYSATIYIGNILTGEIFNSINKTLIGVGDSKELAIMNAISSISTNDTDIANLISGTEQKIINYYNTNGELLLNEAVGYINNHKYEEALAILNSIPKECQALYKKSSKMRFDAIEKYMKNNSDIMLNDFKATLGTERDNIGGFSEKAMAIYRNIPSDSKAKKEADKIYSEYIKSLNPEAKLKHEQDMREWDSTMKQLDRQYELDMYKTEISTKVAIEGQTALLEKYKKDVNYEKMSWLGKLFYFGKE